MKNLNEFNKEKNFLICIDSDGCAINTMDIKHIKCFGPCMVKEWNLQIWEKDILEKWNNVNLYTLTRGINRFKGLAIALEEINQKYVKIEELDDLLNWVKNTNELSNQSLIKEIEKKGTMCLKKALNWSKDVNRCIELLTDDEKLSFKGVKEALEKAHKLADIVIVSSANEKAVLDEWKYNKLIEYTDLILTQNIGTKSFCISKLLEKGYDSKNVLMIGDSKGDFDAAKKNNILFYPIMVKKEIFSWERFKEEILYKFTNNLYTSKYEDKIIKEFEDNFNNN
ncbi:HAD family hydrolase [[Clostridium] colinum]|uniref:HAD family hydrolase n=1 Tax=[Clostridium] colinum TaxID=36835 RepID=UPI0020245D80|nr:HAD hydrolase-like protein [[Clostridium] colinum]